MSPTQASQVCVVTVTYGQRWSLLSQVISSCLLQGVDRVVVVDNGSSESITNLAKNEFTHKVDVVDLKKNTGSAYGFRRGIEHALSLGHQFIWLLDDDNKPANNSLSSLFAAYNYLGESSMNALSCFRPQWPAQCKLLFNGVNTFELPNAFLGFRIFDAPEKIFRRVFLKGSIGNGIINFDLARIPLAPYGGLFMHRDLAQKIDMPDDRLFLYADDTFYSAQIPNIGNGLFLCSQARVEDLTPSWQTGGDGWRGHPFFNPSTNIVRIYFSVRNTLLWEKQYKRGFYYWFNGLMLVGLGLMLSILLGASPKLCFSRLSLLWRAMRSSQNNDFSVPDDVKKAWIKMQT